MSGETYGPFELLAAHQAEVPDSFVTRRRLASAMRELSEHLIRTEASDPEVAAWAEQFEAVLARARRFDRRDTRDANRKLFTGQASARDVFDMMDYDPMGGLANPVSPELRWVKADKDGVEATVRLGLQYQGPPGRVHGGVLGWILDAVLTRAMHAAMHLGVTGTLSLRYHAATPIGEELCCRARVVRSEGRKLFIEGGVYHDGQLRVQADGVWIQPRFAAG